MSRRTPTSGALRLASWTPSTDTHELRSDLRGPFWETDTVALDLRAIRTTRIVRRPLLLTLWLRIITSPAADHLRAATRSAFGSAVICAGLLLGIVLINLAARGGFVDWSGFHAIPGATR